MPSISVGAIIWISVKPVLKLIVIASAGAILARKNHLTSVALKGMSATVINVFLPCLLFSKTVPTFTTETLGQVGVLILTAVFYQVCGLIFALIVRCMTRLPHWRNGLLFAGIFSNWGDIPLAVVMTLTASHPFTAQDQALGVAYISMIMVWCFLTMFPFGGWMLVQRDFDVPLTPPDLEARGRVPNRSWVSVLKKFPRNLPIGRCIGDAALEARIHSEPNAQEPEEFDPRLREEKPPLVTSQNDGSLGTSSISGPKLEIAHRDLPTSQSREEMELPDLSLTPISSSQCDGPDAASPTPSDPLYKRIIKVIVKFLLSMISPPSVACLLSLMVALVPQLKALFVANVPGVDQPGAPDGTPPLEWILDITSFGGGASVPTGLIVLGASLSTLNLRHGLPPWGSVVLMALLKLALLPIVGVLWTQLLTYYTPLVYPDQIMLRFLMILLSGVPTATTQVVLTQVLAPTGRGAEELNSLSAFLISQYIVMLVSLTILVAYSIHLLL